MDSGEQITDTRDEHYNLIGALYHALQGADACDTYALDAEVTGGRPELVDFFRETQISYAAVAERAKKLPGFPQDSYSSGVETEQDVLPEDALITWGCRKTRMWSRSEDSVDVGVVGSLLRALGSQTQHLAGSGVAPPEISDRLKTMGGLLASEGDSVRVRDTLFV